MRIPFFRVAGALSLGVLCAGISTFAAAASPPGPNSDLAGAPRTTDLPAALEITVRTCPPGYDPAAEGADPFADCKEPAGDSMFALDREGRQGPSASTGTSGDAAQESTVSFSQLQPGRYRVAVTESERAAAAFVWSCTSSEREIVGVFTPLTWAGPDGAVSLELVSGESLRCDWFRIAAGQ